MLPQKTGAAEGQPRGVRQVVQSTMNSPVSMMAISALRKAAL